MRSILSILIVISSVVSAYGLEVPFLTGRVNDYAGVIDDDSRATLEQLLKTHEDSTSNQIAVLTISSLEGEILEDFALNVFNTWGLGQKELDNGVLLLVAVTDRQMRIEVGSGLEGPLTDALCSRIIRNEITPSFRQKDFSNGIMNGSISIIDAISGTYEPSGAFMVSSQEPIPFWTLLMMSAIFFIVMIPFTIFCYLSGLWFIFIFLLPFFFIFPVVMYGLPVGLIIFSSFVFGFMYFRYLLPDSGFGKKVKSIRKNLSITSMIENSGKGYATGTSGSNWSSSGSSSWSSSSSSSFSGGGGSSSGGGASGSW